MIFPPELEATAGLQEVWLLPAALATLVLGAVGVLAARKLDRLVTFSVISSMGMVLVTISLFTPESIAAALYYIVHSTLAAALLFLVTDMTRAGRKNLALDAQPPISGAVLTSAFFFVGAIAMAGLPPLSGFLGKLLVLSAAFPTDAMVWVFALVLTSSLVSIVGFSRAGSVLFWKAKATPAYSAAPQDPPPALLSKIAAGGLIALLVAHTVFAGPLHRYMTTTSAQLFAPEPYIEVVLGTPGKLTRPEAAGKAAGHGENAKTPPDEGKAADPGGKAEGH
jgi:multicomponent K+:H+ antiporter subunit D